MTITSLNQEFAFVLPDPLPSTAEEEWSGDETTLTQSQVGSINIQSCDLRFINGAPIQSVWEILVATLLWTKFNKVSMSRKVLQSRLRICDLPDPTHGSLSCYGQESSEDSQQWKTLQLLLVQAISLLASLLQTSWSKFLAFKNGERRDSSVTPKIVRLRKLS